MKENKIIVNSRKEFMEYFRKIFIKEMSDRNLLSSFNIGYSLNNWTSFYIFNEDMSFVTVVELIDKNE